MTLRFPWRKVCLQRDSANTFSGNKNLAFCGELCEAEAERAPSGAAAQNMGLGAGTDGTESQLHCMRALGLWASRLTSLSLSFLISTISARIST